MFVSFLSFLFLSFVPSLFLPVFICPFLIFSSCLLFSVKFLILSLVTSFFFHFSNLIIFLPLSLLQVNVSRCTQTVSLCPQTTTGECNQVYTDCVSLSSDYNRSDSFDPLERLDDDWRHVETVRDIVTCMSLPQVTGVGGLGGGRRVRGR